MEKKEYGDRSFEDLRFHDWKLAIEPNTQMLIGYKIEYLIYLNGNITLPYVHSIEELDNCLTEKINKYEKLRDNNE